MISHCSLLPLVEPPPREHLSDPPTASGARLLNRILDQFLNGLGWIATCSYRCSGAHCSPIFTFYTFSVKVNPLTQRRNALVLAVASALTAATILAAIPVVFGSPQAQIHIQWRDVNEVERVTLEQRFALTESTRLTEDTWSYVPADISAERLGAIVRDPAVVDASGINRFTLRISDAPSLTPRRGGLLEAPRMARGVKLLGYLFAGLAAVLLGRAILVSPPVQRRIVAAGGLRPALRRGLGPTITRGIPELPAEILGFFRFFYAAFLFLALAGSRSRLAPGRVADAWPDWRWVAWLAGRTDVMAALEYGLFALLVLFAIGLFTRVAYWLIVAGMTTCVLVSIQSHEASVHVWIVAVFTMLCLIPAPWHATPLSVDDAIRRWRGRASAKGLRGKSYGYAVWMPGLILGTVWGSAAYSKMEGDPNGSSAAP